MSVYFEGWRGSGLKGDMCCLFQETSVKKTHFIRFSKKLRSTICGFCSSQISIFLRSVSHNPLVFLFNPPPPSTILPSLSTPFLSFFATFLFSKSPHYCRVSSNSGKVALLIYAITFIQTTSCVLITCSNTGAVQISVGCKAYVRARNQMISSGTANSYETPPSCPQRA